jgi:hypothetical protein
MVQDQHAFVCPDVDCGISDAEIQLQQSLLPYGVVKLDHAFSSSTSTAFSGFNTK